MGSIQKAMSKIWFFGDSYAAINSSSEKSWTINVVEAFPEHDTENHAYGGSSLDYLYYTYNKQRKAFQQGDIVIFTITNSTRLFLSGGVKRPHFMNVNWKSTENGREDHVRGDKYYDYFVSELFNIDSVAAMLDIFLDFLYHESMTKGIKIIGLPISGKQWNSRTLNTVPPVDYKTKSRGNLHIACGDKSLAEATAAQFPNKDERKKLDKTYANHLTPRNNEILANKVIRHIKTNETIDLTTEWEYT